MSHIPKYFNALCFFNFSRLFCAMVVGRSLSTTLIINILDTTPYFVKQKLKYPLALKSAHYFEIIFPIVNGLCGSSPLCNL